MSSTDHFPTEGWFFIKNLLNGYVLAVAHESQDVDENIIITTMRHKDHDSQLWHHGEDGRIYNKKSGFVLDVSKGKVKAGSDIVQQTVSTANNHVQAFGVTAEGHIFLENHPQMVLGIKESLFGRRDKSPVHLQSLEKRSEDHKEQRWDFVMPVANLKRISTMASLSSLKHDGASVQSESSKATTTTFPANSPFLIKAKVNGQFVGIEAETPRNGAPISLSTLRKATYETQLWTYDAVSGRLTNKHSGLLLSVADTKEGTSVCQSAPSPAYLQCWEIQDHGEIALKHDTNWILGLKANWISGYKDEGLPLQLQHRNGDVQHHQMFSVVVPVYKKTSEIVFPQGQFFIKNQKHDLVLAVSDADHLASSVVATKMDTSPSNYSKQLWTHRNGFIVNQASGMVLDVKGGCIVKGAHLCQYKEKAKESENQQWALTADGRIYVKANDSLVISVLKDGSEHSHALLSYKSSDGDATEQKWSFIVPVFKKSQVPKVVTSFHYAQYPSGYFFIQSFGLKKEQGGAAVLTADTQTRSVRLQEISKVHWRTQLWTLRDGLLFNLETQAALGVTAPATGAPLVQTTTRQDTNQHWRLTVDGYLVNGQDETLVVEPHKIAGDMYQPVLSVYSGETKFQSWQFLTPELTFQSGIQGLLSWTTASLKEYTRTEIQTTSVRVAAWPSTSFFLRSRSGDLLVPRDANGLSSLVLRKFDALKYSAFLWSFQRGYLTHCDTGLVLHAKDNLIDGSELQIRGQLLANNNVSIDARQQWQVRTNGSIISALQPSLGFALLKQDDGLTYAVLRTSKNAVLHTDFIISYPYADSHHVVTDKEIVLTAEKTSSTPRQMVTETYQEFPEDWFYIRSKVNPSFVLATSNHKEGAKLELTKLDLKHFRAQLWHFRDDGCLANLESDMVIDIAGGKVEDDTSVIQWHEKHLKRRRANQMWDLSTDGRIHPKANLNFVLCPKNNRVEEGARVKIYARNARPEQQWTFSIPIFGQRRHQHSFSLTHTHDKDLWIERVEDVVVKTSVREVCKRVTTKKIVRHVGVFPEDSFFIRSTVGQDRLFLSVIQSSKTKQDNQIQYRVGLQSINFKDYKWCLWQFEKGRLVNVETGLALDMVTIQGEKIEEGLRSALYVRSKSVNDGQFWSLSAKGSIYLKSNERLVVGPASLVRAKIHGAQVGVCHVRVKSVTEGNTTTKIIDADEWMTWTLSKPVFASAQTSGAASTAESAIERREEHSIQVSDVEEAAPGDSSSSASLESSSEDESESDSNDEEVVEKEPVKDNKAKDAAAGAAVAVAATAAVVASVVADAKDKPEKSVTDTTETKKEVVTVTKEVTRIVSVSWVKETIRHSLTEPNQWPRCDTWFLIRDAHSGRFLAVGDQNKDLVSYFTLDNNVDYRRFLWIYVHGFLVNHKYMLCLAVNKERKCVLSEAHEAVNQSFVITQQGTLKAHIDKEEVSLSLSGAIDANDTYLVTSTSDKATVTVEDLELHIPIHVDTAGRKALDAAAVAAQRWLHSQCSNVTTVVTHRAVFPVVPWFFIAVKRSGSESEECLAAGPNDSVIITKISLTQYISQLWTHRDGLLINYLSKRTLAIKDNVETGSKVVVSDNKNVSTQAWSLSREGEIQLTYYDFALGYQGDLGQGTLVELVPNSHKQVLNWSFAVPVFGKKKLLEEALADRDAMTRVQTVTVLQQDELPTDNKQALPDDHKATHLLKDMGMVAATGAAAVAVVGAANQWLSSKCSKEEEEAKKKDSSAQVIDVKVKQVVSMSQHYSASILAESRIITRAWRITFVRRIRRCKTRKDVATLIIEGQRGLYRRLDEHVRVYALVNHATAGQKSEMWHTSVEHVKELYRVRVFEILSDKLQSYSDSQKISVESLSIDEMLDSISIDIDQTYNDAVKVDGSTTVTTTDITVGKVSSKEQVLLYFDTIHIIVRFWSMSLRQKMVEASNSKASLDEKAEIIKQSMSELRKSLDEQRDQIHKSVTALTESQQTTVEQTLLSSLTVVSEVIETHTEKARHMTDFSEKAWIDYVEEGETAIDYQLKPIRDTMVQEFYGEFYSSNQTVSRKTSEETAKAAKDTISNKLRDTEQRLVAWYNFMTQEITEHIQEVKNMSSSEEREQLVILANAGQVEGVAIVEEAKLLLLAHVDWLTHLSEAERLRLVHATENLKLSIVATMIRFKHLFSESTTLTSKDVSNYITCAFGPVAQKITVERLTIITRSVSEEKAPLPTVVPAVTPVETPAVAPAVIPPVKPQPATTPSRPAETALALGVATSVVAAIAVHHHKAKHQNPDSVHVETAISKPIGHLYEKAESKTTISEKSIRFDHVPAVIESWLTSLNAKVIERAKQKGEHVSEDIDTIIAESEVELMSMIEVAKHSATLACETKVSAAHDSLFYIRSKLFSHIDKLKYLAKTMAATDDCKTCQEAETRIQEQTKETIEMTRVCIHETSDDLVGATMRTPETLPQDDITVIQAKTHVAVFTEETKRVVKSWFERFTNRVTERVKQGGDRVATDVAMMIQESRKEIDALIKAQKPSITSTSQVQLVEAHGKMEEILVQIHQITLVEVTRIQQVVQTSQKTDRVLVELASAKESSEERIDGAFSLSEEMLDQHLDVVAIVAKQKSDQKLTAIQDTTTVVALDLVGETTKTVSSHICSVVERVYCYKTHGVESKGQTPKVIISTARKDISTVCKTTVLQLQKDQRFSDKVKTEITARIKSIETAAEASLKDIEKYSAMEILPQNITVRNGLRRSVEGFKVQVLHLYDEAKKETTESETCVEQTKKVLAKSTAVAAGSAIAAEVVKVLRNKSKEESQPVTPKPETTRKEVITKVEVDTVSMTAIEETKTSIQNVLHQLIVTITTQYQKGTLTTEEANKLIAKAKDEMKQHVSAAKSNNALRQNHHRKAIEWVSSLVTIQVTRIQEITIQCLSPQNVTDLGPRLEALDEFTKQEITTCFEECKHGKTTLAETKISSEVIVQKEVAILDARSEMSITLHHVTSDLNDSFSRRVEVIEQRLKKGDQDAKKDAVTLIERLRIDIQADIQRAKSTVTELLSDASSKTTAAAISGVALAGIATTEIISALNSAEEKVVNKIHTIHEAVQSDAECDKVLGTIATVKVDTKTTFEEASQRSISGFVAAACKHQSAGHIDTVVETAETTETTTIEKVTVTQVQDLKVVLRDWFRNLTNAMSKRAIQGGNETVSDLYAIADNQCKALFIYLDQCTTDAPKKMSQQDAEEMRIAVSNIKTIVTERVVEIKQVGRKASSSPTGGYEAMTAVVVASDKQLNEAFLHWNKPKSIAQPPVETKVDIGTPLAVAVATSYAEQIITQCLNKLVVDVSQRAKQGGGPQAKADIDQLVLKAKDSISTELDMISGKLNGSTKQARSNLVSIITWSRGMALQGVEQVHAIGIQSVAPSNPSGGREQMQPLVDAINGQVKVALDRCDKSVVISVESFPETTPSETTKTVNKEKSQTKEIVGTTVVSTTTKTVSVVTIRTVIRQWFDTLLESVTVRAKKGGATAAADIEKLVKDSKLAIFEVIMTANMSASDMFKDEDTCKRFRETIEWAKGMVVQASSQVQVIGIQASTKGSNVTVQESLKPLLASIQQQIDGELSRYEINDRYDQESVTVDADENTEVILTWFACVTERLVQLTQEHKDQTKAQQVIYTEARNAEKELEGIVTKARAAFLAQLSQNKNISDSIFQYICKNYEKHILVVQKTIKAEIAEAEKVTVVAIKNGNIGSLKYSLDKLMEETTQRVHSVMKTNVKITEQVTTDTMIQTIPATGVQVTLHDDTDEEFVGVSDVEMEIQEAKVEMYRKQRKGRNSDASSKHGSIASSTDVSDTAGSMTCVHKEGSKTKKKQEHVEIEVEHDDSIAAQVEGLEVGHAADTKQHSTGEIIAAGAAALGTAAVAYGVYKDHQQSKGSVAPSSQSSSNKQSVEIISVSTLTTIKTRLVDWYTKLNERLLVSCDDLSDKQARERNAAQAKEEAIKELDVILNEAKTVHESQSKEEHDYSFAETLVWIRNTANVHADEVQKVIVETDSKEAAACQIENMTIVSEQHVETALQVHTETQVVIQHSESGVLHGVEEEHKTSGSTVVAIRKDSKEQVEQRAEHNRVVIVQTTHQRLNAWIDDLVLRIKTVLEKLDSCDEDHVRKELKELLAKAEQEETKTFVKETKRQFASVQTILMPSHTDTKVLKTTETAQRQVLTVMDTVVATSMVAQITILRQYLLKGNLNDRKAINQSLHAITTRSKQRLGYLVEQSTRDALNTGFNEKTTTWTETSTLPASFANVHAVAFDVFGTVTDDTIMVQAWESVMKKSKNSSELASLDASLLVTEWKAQYVQCKQDKTQAAVDDTRTLRTALSQVLRKYKVKDVGEEDAQLLCKSWYQLPPTGDAIVGIRQLKQHNLMNVAMSTHFSTRSLVNIARNSCFCWHAQFASDMFSKGEAVSSTVVIENMTKLLALNQPNQLAIVSADPQLISEAKSIGCHTVLIDRSGKLQSTVKTDVYTTGIDVFAESVEAFVKKNGNRTTPSLSWFDRLKQTLSIDLE